MTWTGRLALLLFFAMGLPKPITAQEPHNPVTSGQFSAYQFPKPTEHSYTKEATDKFVTRINALVAHNNLMDAYFLEKWADQNLTFKFGSTQFRGMEYLSHFYAGFQDRIDPGLKVDYYVHTAGHERSNQDEPIAELKLSFDIKDVCVPISALDEMVGTQRTISSALGTDNAPPRYDFAPKVINSKLSLWLLSPWMPPRQTSASLRLI